MIFSYRDENKLQLFQKLYLITKQSKNKNKTKQKTKQNKTKTKQKQKQKHANLLCHTNPAGVCCDPKSPLVTSDPMRS